MWSEAFVQLALQLLACNQKELAARIGVSPTQISLWKKGDHLSFEMENKLRGVMGIGNRHPEFILWAGGLESAIKWERLIQFLSMDALESQETGYVTEPLRDDNELLCWSTFHTLIEMGVEIPKEFPKDLDFDFNRSDFDWNILENNPYTSLIYRIYLSLNDVYGFFAAYVQEIIYEDSLGLMGTPAENIESCLIDLAASKLDVEDTFAKNFRAFRYRINSNFEGWLGDVKLAAFRAGLPLKAELLDLVYKSHGEVGHEAEAESLGFNNSKLHPDVYMNELLVGMRVIHQVLPAILRKLGIDDEFELDSSALRLK